MKEQPRANPSAYFFLVLPYGISHGFVSITLPFILVREGFSVAAVAVALGQPLAIRPVIYMASFDGWAHDRFGTAFSVS